MEVPLIVPAVTSPILEEIAERFATFSFSVVIALEAIFSAVTAFASK